MSVDLNGSSGSIHVDDHEVIIKGPSGTIKVPVGDGSNSPPAVSTGGAAAPGGSLPGPKSNIVMPGPGATSTAGGVPPAAFLKKYQAYFDAASKATGVPANLLAAIAWKESRGDAGAPGGGLMQIDPTPKSPANPQGGAFEQEKSKHPGLIPGGINDPASNIMAAAFYLKEQKDRFGSWELALRAYNSGPEGTDPKNPNATPAKTGDPQYVILTMQYWGIINKGGNLPP